MSNNFFSPQKSRHSNWRVKMHRQLLKQLYYVMMTPFEKVKAQFYIQACLPPAATAFSKSIICLFFLLAMNIFCIFWGSLPPRIATHSPHGGLEKIGGILKAYDGNQHLQSHSLRIPCKSQIVQACRRKKVVRLQHELGRHSPAHNLQKRHEVRDRLSQYLDLQVGRIWTEAEDKFRQVSYPSAHSIVCSRIPCPASFSFYSTHYERLHLLLMWRNSVSKKLAKG